MRDVEQEEGRKGKDKEENKMMVEGVKNTCAWAHYGLTPTQKNANPMV